MGWGDVCGNYENNGERDPKEFLKITSLWQSVAYWVSSDVKSDTAKC